LRIFRTSLFLFDTIGISVFTLVGIEAGLAIQLSPIICILLGTITACCGGVIRDTLCNEIPVIFRKEIYATACLSGGIIFFALQMTNLPNDIISITTTVTIMLTRLLAVRYHWSLLQIQIKK